MKFSHVLPLAAFSTALVLPADEAWSQVAIEDNHRGNSFLGEAASTKDAVLKGFKQHFDQLSSTSKHVYEEVADKAKNSLDAAFAYTEEVATVFETSLDGAAFDANAWLESERDSAFDLFNRHHGPPRDGPPHHGPPGDDDHPPHHGPPGKGRPHHPPHHGKPNLTVYELIAGSKYTTKLAKLINEYPDLVKTLNGTEANYTIFAPTDKAFEKIPEHHKKPSKETIEKILQYHVVPDFYPAGRVLATHTFPTLLKLDSLGEEPLPQRLARRLGLGGLTINFYARVVAVDIFGTNGVIHGIDSLLVPPPNVIKIIDLLPSEFSTLELGLGKTGLLETLNTTDHAGGTFFAPSNFAFQKLGPKINAFLFSTYGQKYLKALLQYHVVPKNTLYSDAYYTAKSGAENVPKGYFHVDLPTMLEDRTLAVDIARYGGYISIKVNAFSRVTVADGIAEDGVIQVVSDVLVPPKKLGPPGSAAEAAAYWQGEDMSVEEFVERLEPFVAEQDL